MNKGSGHEMESTGGVIRFVRSLRDTCYALSVRGQFKFSQIEKCYNNKDTSLTPSSKRDDHIVALTEATVWQRCSRLPFRGEREGCSCVRQRKPVKI